MERLFELIKDQQRQTSELVADLREERLNRKEERFTFLITHRKNARHCWGRNYCPKKEA